MNTYIILLRAINVGGNNVLPMKALVPLLKEHGFSDVSSYIQSGNIVLKSDRDPREPLQALVSTNFGFSPELFILKDSELSTIAAQNPYSEYEGKFVHFYFCHHAITVDQEQLQKWISSTEQYEVHGNVFYFYAPDGVGRSKLVANIEKCLGQAGTGRNLNTINKLGAMVAKLS